MAKKVYQYSNITELQEKGKLAKMDKLPVKNLCESSKKVLTKAEEEFKLGEDESSYILFWKLCELLQIIVKRVDYKKDERYFEGMYNVKANFKKALDKVSVLEKRLEEAYKLKAKEKEEKPPDPDIGTPKSSRKPVTRSMTNTGPNGVLGGLNGESKHVPAENGIHNGNKKDYETMTARDLYSLIHQKSSSYLILDTRSTDDFKKSSIKFNSVSLAEDKLRGHATPNAFEKFVVSLQDRGQWQRRDKVDKLILVDWNSKDIETNAAIFAVHSAITKWDKDKTYKDPPFLLEEGFEMFRLAYPHLVTDPKHKMPDYLRIQEKPKDSSNLDLNKVIFPNLDQGFIVSPSPSPTLSQAAISSGAISITKSDLNTTDSNINISSLNGFSTNVNYPSLAGINLVPTFDRTSKPSTALTTNSKRMSVDESATSNGQSDDLNNARLSGISVDLSQPNSAFSSTSSLNNAMLASTLGLDSMVNGSLSTAGRTLVPKVDRTSKAKAESVYSRANEAKSRGDLDGMLEVAGQLADLSLDRRKENLEKELQWAKLCQKREEEANEEMRAIHDTEAQFLSEELDARNKEIKEAEERERQLKNELERLRDELSKNQVLNKNVEQNRNVETQKKVRFKEEEDLKLKGEIEEIRKKRKLKEQQQLEERREKRAQQKALLELERRRKAEDFERLEREADIRRKIDADAEREKRLENMMEQKRLKEERMRGIDEQRRLERLKDDGPSESVGSGNRGKLRRSNSCVNVAQMLNRDEGPSDRPGAGRPNDDRFNVPVPKFDRKQKPMDIIKRDFAGVWGTTNKPGLTGLRNLGNTCYMNSILQCVSNTEPIVQYFVSRDFEEDLNKYSDTRGEVAIEFAAVLQQLWSHQYKSISPTDIKSAVGRFKREFSGRDQQDSHEFLSKLLEWLHNDTNRIKKPSKMPEIDASNLHPQEASKVFWRSFLERNQSIIVQLFHGLTQQTTTCVDCNFKSLKFQEFYNLNLFIPEDRNRISLEECLRHYVRETECEYTCEKCRSTRGAKQRTEIIKLPPILIIHLERFLPDEQMLSRSDEIRYRKKQTFVNYRLTGLNLEEFTRGRENKYTSFNLYAVSNHFGSLEGGHYTATCYSKQGRSWYKYDDQDVSQIEDSRVESTAAYILFYSALDSNHPLLPLG